MWFFMILAVYAYVGWRLAAPLLLQKPRHPGKQPMPQEWIIAPPWERCTEVAPRWSIIVGCEHTSEIVHISRGRM